MTKQPYLTINIIGILSVILCFLSEQWADIGATLTLWIMLFFAMGIGFIVLLVINIASFLAVKNDRKILGILLSLPLGSLGAFLAVALSNSEYEFEEMLTAIFSVHIWFVLWLIASYIAYGVN